MSIEALRSGIYPVPLFNGAMKDMCLPCPLLNGVIWYLYPPCSLAQCGHIWPVQPVLWVNETISSLYLPILRLKRPIEDLYLLLEHSKSKI